MPNQADQLSAWICANPALTGEDLYKHALRQGGTYAIAESPAGLCNQFTFPDGSVYRFLVKPSIVELSNV